MKKHLFWSHIVMLMPWHIPSLLANEPNKSLYEEQWFTSHPVLASFKEGKETVRNFYHVLINIKH